MKDEEDDPTQASKQDCRHQQESVVLLLFYPALLFCSDVSRAATQCIQQRSTHEMMGGGAREMRALLRWALLHPGEVLHLHQLLQLRQKRLRLRLRVAPCSHTRTLTR
jgi:hypothetical protein